ncbi:MAG: GYD domain-containing protein [Deltaproteobacteria bacterium]
MPKFLIQASYSSEGIKGLAMDKASGRKAAVAAAIKSVGGKLECMYYSFGDYDVVLVAELPDAASAASMAFSVSSTGLAHTKTTPLLTIEETDTALGKSVSYKAPGK